MNDGIELRNIAHPVERRWWKRALFQLHLWRVQIFGFTGLERAEIQLRRSHVKAINILNEADNE